MGQNLTTRAKISLAIISLFLPVALAGCGGTSNSSPSTGVYECQENAATYGVNCFYGNVARTGSDVSTAEAAQFRAGKPFEYRIQDPNGADTYKASLTKQQGSLSTSNFNLSGTIFHTVVTSLATGVVTQTIDVVIDPKAYGVEVTIPGQPAFSETATTSISSMIQDDAAFTPSYLRHVVGDISGDTANASVNY